MEEELEKNQKVGEPVTQVEQTASPSPRRIRSGASASSSLAATKAAGEDLENGIMKVTTHSEEAVSKIILKSIPSDSQITFVRFEGPNIALYTKNPKFALTELTYFLSSLSKTLKKRFIIRTDPSSRLPEDQTRQAVVNASKRCTGISNILRRCNRRGSS
jgi:hypothetical protein